MTILYLFKIIAPLVIKSEHSLIVGIGTIVITIKTTFLMQGLINVKRLAKTANSIFQLLSIDIAKSNHVIGYNVVMEKIVGFA